MSRASLLAVCVLGIISVFAVPAGTGDSLLSAAASAQNLGMRTVSGTVLNASSQAVASATVFLKNTKTKAIRSYSTTPDGHFHFAQVDMSIDFDLWAEKDGKKSATKTVSSWDARKDFILDLKLK